MKIKLCALLLWSVGLQVLAQTQTPAIQADAQETLDQQRADIAAHKQAVMDAHAKLREQCWQRFAVNDCLRDVRRAQRKALEPVQAEQIALNARERNLRLQEREQRLQDKAKP